MADETERGHARKRLTFDPTINAGHVLTFLAMAAAVITSWSLLDKRLTVVEQAQTFQRERDQHQDQAVNNKFADIKDKLDKIDRGLEELRRDQINQQRRALP